MSFDFGVALRSQYKALPNHPALRSGAPTSLYSPGAGRTDAVISQREANRHTTAYGGEQAIDWVYDCIGLYSDPVATAPYSLSKEDGTRLVRVKSKGTPPDHEVGPADLYRLLDAPNPFMLYDELMSLLIIDLLLVGNAYWLKWRMTEDDRPLALYRLAPSYVKIVPGPFGPKRYEYQPPGAKDPLKIDPREIVHFRRPNPHSAYYGMGVIQGAGRAMDLELAITDTMASYYENKADPSLIVQSERRVPRDVFNKLRAQLRARVSGPKRAGDLLVLEAGLKSSSLSPSARDALFDTLSKMSRDRVFTKFRASPMLFGLMDESAGSNKVSDARREFDNSALRPFMDRLAGPVTAGLTAAWGVKFGIDYNYTMPPEEASKIAGEIAKAPGIKVREVRRQYRQFGIEESTGDPEIDEMILNLPGEELDEDGQGGFADRPLPGEAGRPPKGENTKNFPRNGNLPADAKVRAGKALADLKALVEQHEAKALNPAGERVTVGNHLPDERRPEDRFINERNADINSAVGYIERELAAAATTLERDLLDHVEGKALKTSDLVGRVRRSAAWSSFRERVTAILEEGARRAAASGVMHSGLEPEDDVDYDTLVKSVVHRPEGVRSIIKTLRERVVSRLKQTRDKDGERQDFEATVREAIKGWTQNQAATIAEAEAVHAYNEATLTVAEASGINEVYVTDGEDTDQPCIEANGSVWSIERARENRLEHPRCRRAFLPLSPVTSQA
jgi:HK97 family phage portal protein